jgi:hypothetical protein
MRRTHPIAMRFHLSVVLSPALTVVPVSLLALTLGCSAGNDRVALSGKVTFDGQPIEQGQIVFAPQGTGFTAAAPIVAGAYTISAEKGASPGATYTVRITADRSTGRTVQASGYAANEPPQEVYEQYVPAKYNESSELQFEVGAESELVKDFELVGD